MVATAQALARAANTGKNPLPQFSEAVTKLVKSKRPNLREAAKLLYQLDQAASRTRVPARKAEYTKLRKQIYSQVFGSI